MTVKFRFDDRFGVAETRMKVGAVFGLRMGAELLLEVSNRTVPIEEKILLASGTVEVDEAGLQSAVGYDTAYAARQHEETTWRHDPGRRAKWLELTLQEQQEAIMGVIGAGIAGTLR